jgi:hypothetical protein
MVARILAAVARAEVERKGARQRLAAEQRAKAGKAWWPRRPFGLEMDGSLREDEAEALRKAYRDLLAGVSLLTLARDLNEAAYFTNRGKPWTATSLRPVLLNARNAGIRVYEGEEVGQADWEAIVPEETYRAAVRVLNDPGRDTGGGGRIPRNLVSGIAVCGRHGCGGDAKVGWRGRRKGAEGACPVYVCRRSSCVSHRLDWVDTYVTERIVQRLSLPGAAAVSVSGEGEGDAADLRAEVASLRERLDALAEDYAEGLLSRSQMLAGSERLRERLERAEAPTQGRKR